MSESLARQSSLRRLLRNALKLAICGASIFAIAFIIAVVGTKEPIQTSHADLTWLSPFERSKTERFETALTRLGHNEPARFNLNGNTVFFSHNTSRKQPRQVAAEYQEEFVRQKLNKQVFTRLDAQNEDDRNFTALTGGLVPLAITNERIVLGGVVARNNASTPEELLQNMASRDGVTDLFRAHRYIEISRPKNSRHTSIVATWSDEAFELERMNPASRAASGAFDPIVPSCPGCTRLTRFADENPGTAERVEIAFTGPQTLEETRYFYQQTMAREGWRPAGFNADLSRVEQLVDIERPEGNSLVFSRDGIELMLSFLPDPRTGQTLTLATYTS